jgi:hypothetical protein
MPRTDRWHDDRRWPACAHWSASGATRPSSSSVNPIPDWTATAHPVLRPNGALNTTCAKLPVCYNATMATKNDQKSQRTALVPVITMEELPVLTTQERAEFIDSLEAAEARVETGEFVEYDAETFEDRLLDIHRNARRADGV